MKDKEKKYISMKEMQIEKSIDTITNYRQVKEGAFVDLLNKEIKELENSMKDKEKCFICNKDITNELPKIDVNGNHYCSDCYIDKCKTELKVKQINEMARIIDDNHGFIVSSVETAQAIYNAGYKKQEDNEELAQKIYDDIFAILKIKLWLYGDDAMTKNLNGLTKQKILDFTKKWGIKDNHLNEKDYSHIDHLQVHDKQIKDQARKETAEKLANFIKSKLFDLGNIVNERDVNDMLKEFLCTI